MWGFLQLWAEMGRFWICVLAELPLGRNFGAVNSNQMPNTYDHSITCQHPADRDIQHSQNSPLRKNNGIPCHDCIFPPTDGLPRNPWALIWQHCVLERQLDSARGRVLTQSSSAATGRASAVPDHDPKPGLAFAETPRSSFSRWKSRLLAVSTQLVFPPMSRKLSKRLLVSSNLYEQRKSIVC